MTLNFDPKLNFELDNKQIFGSNWTLCDANIELSLNFEPARRSKLKKKVTNNDIEFRAEIEFRAREEILFLFKFDTM